MNDLREKLAEVICEDRAVDNMFALPCDYDLADAIIAALPGMVKPLEFGPQCSWVGQPAWYADTEFGPYMIVDHSIHGNSFVLEGPGVCVTGIASRDEAITIANDQYRAAIMAALGVEGE